MKRRNHRGSFRPGFTLMETLIAIALLAGLLVAAVSILFQVSAAWASQADDPVADRHVEGLARFVRTVFSQSGSAGVSAPTAEQVSREGAFLAVRPPGDLPMFDRLATEGGAVEARFALAPEGAFLLFWNTSGERLQSPGKSHRVLLSSWVVSAKVFVYDAENRQCTEYVPGDSGAGAFGAATSLRVLRIEVDRLGQRRVMEIPLPRSGV